MADYKDKKTLDSSVAGEFDICNVGFSENVPFEIENEEEEWADAYELNIYNSNKKNTSFLNSPIGVVGSRMIFSIYPEEVEGMTRGNFYFEIFNTVKKRVEFKGDLQVIQ